MKDHVLLLMLLLTLLLQHTALHYVLPLTPVCFHHSTGNLSWEEQGRTKVLYSINTH